MNIDNNNSTNKIDEEIEFVDLNETSEPIVDNSEVTLQSKKEDKIIIIIVAVVLLAAIFIIPVVSNYISNISSRTTTGKTSEIDDSNTVDGYLEIGTTGGYIIARKVQFYSFIKKSDNIINLKYMATSSINNVSDLNLYIELYNSKKNVIYREKFNPSEKLSRKVIGEINLEPGESIYGEAMYAKITILDSKSFNVENSKMTCTLNEVNDDYTLNTTIVYYFSNNGLNKINVKKSLITNDDTTDEESDYLTMITKEGSSLESYSLDKLEYDDSKIEYTADLVKVSNIDSLFKLGSTPRQVKSNSEKNSWRCE